jgi:hypothetical protein
VFVGIVSFLIKGKRTADIAFELGTCYHIYAHDICFAYDLSFLGIHSISFLGPFIRFMNTGSNHEPYELTKCLGRDLTKYNSLLNANLTALLRIDLIYA